MAAEFDMEEADFFEAEPALSPSSQNTANQEDSDDDDLHDAPTRGRGGGGGNDTGVHSESAKSSTLGVTIEDCFDTEASPAPPTMMARSPMVAVPLAAPMRGRAPRYPSHGANTSRAGTSVPVDIPFLRPARSSDEGGPDEDGQDAGEAREQYPGTFIPPHQLSQRKNPMSMFSLHGDSPASAFKRERLKNRNAILTRTGFLEGRPPPAPAAAAPGSSLERQGLAFAIRGGGLSQALGQNSPSNRTLS